MTRSRVDGVCAARTPSRRRRLSSLEEHRPRLRRDDRDEAEHEVHLGPDLGHLRDFDPYKRRRRDDGTSDAADERRARTCG